MKPQPRLQDMPYLVKRRIVKHMWSYHDQMSLRTASRDFRKVIGNPSFHCSLFQLGLSEETGELQLEFQSRVETFQKVWKRGPIELMVRMAAHDFRMLTDNPNFSISRFKISLSGAPTSLLFRIGTILANMKVQLRVKKLFMCYGSFDQADAIRILRHLDSEALEWTKLMRTTSTDLSSWCLFGKSQHEKKRCRWEEDQRWSRSIARNPYRKPRIWRYT